MIISEQFSYEFQVFLDALQGGFGYPPDPANILGRRAELFKLGFCSYSSFGDEVSSESCADRSEITPSVPMLFSYAPCSVVPSDAIKQLSDVVSIASELNEFVSDVENKRAEYNYVHDVDEMILGVEGYGYTQYNADRDPDVLTFDDALTCLVRDVCDACVAYSLKRVSRKVYLDRCDNPDACHVCEFKVVYKDDANSFAILRCVGDFVTLPPVRGPADVPWNEDVRIPWYCDVIDGRVNLFRRSD